MLVFSHDIFFVTNVLRFQPTCFLTLIMFSIAVQPSCWQFKLINTRNLRGFAFKTLKMQLFFLAILVTLIQICHGSGSGNLYQNDVFAPEKVPVSWWNDNVTEVLPSPISQIECSIKCLALTLEVCNAYIYSNGDGCTLGQLDYVPLLDPPFGYTMIVTSQSRSQYA